MSRDGLKLPDMGAIIDLTVGEWDLVADLFDPECRRGAPEVYPRRLMVEAMLWMARTGVPWRHLPVRFPPWTAVWSQRRRWRAKRGVGPGARRPSAYGAPNLSDSTTCSSSSRSAWVVSDEYVASMTRRCPLTSRTHSRSTWPATC